MNILHIDSSILGEYSASRRLTSAIAERFMAQAPDASLVYRDVVQNEVPQLTGALAGIATIPLAEQSPALRAAAAEREAVLDEVLAANVIIIGAPMYNFSVSSQLKAWIDALAIAGKTFAYDTSGPKGLLGGKRVIVASTRGNLYSEGSPHSVFDHQEKYLHGFFSFLCITDFEVVRAEGLKLSDDSNQASMKLGLRQAAELQVA